MDGIDTGTDTTRKERAKVLAKQNIDRSFNHEQTRKRLDEWIYIVELRTTFVVRVAHIYPYSLNTQVRKHQFFATLRAFWPREQVDNWMQLVSGPKGSEAIQNLICLSPTAHRMHGRGCFALEFIEENEEKSKSVTRFHWLKTAIPEKTIDILEPPSLSTDFPPDYGLYMYQNTSNDGSHVHSGQEIHLETPDPINLPLPHSSLLELQWLMNRVLALSGAAEAQSLWYNEDDDDDFDPWLMKKDVSESDDSDTDVSDLADRI